MIKDVWCNVIIPIIVAEEVNKDDDEYAGFLKIEERFYNRDPNIKEKIFSSFNEGHGIIEWQEQDEIEEE